MRDFRFIVFRAPLAGFPVVSFEVSKCLPSVVADNKSAICRAISFKSQITSSALRVDIIGGKVIVEPASSSSDVVSRTHRLPSSFKSAGNAGPFIPLFDVEGKGVPELSFEE